MKDRKQMTLLDKIVGGLLVWLIISFAVGLALQGCASSGTTQDQEASQKLYLSRLEHIKSLMIKMEETQRQADISVEGNAEKVIKYGVDPAAERLIARGMDKAENWSRSGASALLSLAIGWSLLLLFVDAPANGRTKVWGIFIGIALLMFAPILMKWF